MAQKWEFLTDLINTILINEPNNILALQYQLLEILITSGDQVKANEVLNKIISVIEKDYWGNTSYWILEIAKLVNSIAANNKPLLHTNIVLLNKAYSVYRENYLIAS